MAPADTSERLKASWSPRLAVAFAIAIYRAAISPVIHALNGPACRFEPSCSAYARDAIAHYGIVRGGAMAIWRIARCNPMGGHGYDPVAGVEARSGVRFLCHPEPSEGSRAPARVWPAPDAAASGEILRRGGSE